MFNIQSLLSINVSSSDGAQRNLCNNTYHTCTTFGNYTHGWFLLARLNSFPVTFMSSNRAKCGTKFPAVLIVLGSDVQRTRSYVWIEVIVIHLHSLSPSLSLSSLPFPTSLSVFLLLRLSDSPLTHIRHTFLISMWRVKWGRNTNKMLPEQVCVCC